MRALIMAGGAGTRLGLGEKPLIDILGKPMIHYVITAFSEAGCEPVIVLSAKTPMTANWCRAHGINTVRTCGAGYISDMEEAVRQMEEKEPVIVSVSDIPCITGAIIQSVLDEYSNCFKDALSVWIPACQVRSCRGGMPYREKINGIEACPAGINIIRGSLIGNEQDECTFLIDEAALTFNVNTREDLARTKAFLESLSV